MKKLGLSVYENDRTPCRGGKYAVVVDESIFINSEKLLLLLGIPARHKGEPVKHEDVTVIGMKVGKTFNGDDIKQEIEEAATQKQAATPSISSMIRRTTLRMESPNLVLLSTLTSVMPWAQS